MTAFALASQKVVTPHGVSPGAVVVARGEIAAVVPYGDIPAGIAVEDVGDLVVLPGLVDSHVHVNEPGRTEWEGFETATRAAAAGGVTTLVDMPLNCIPVTTTLEAFREKLRAIAGRLYIDCAFWGGVVPGNADELEAMVDAGVMGFKCFLIHSGIDDFPNVGEGDLRQAMPVLERLGVPLLVHAELESGAGNGDAPADPREYAAYLASRPDRWEERAIALMVDLCRQYGCRVHIVHLSSAQALPLVQDARRSGLPFTTETCPHYLTLAAEDVPAGDTRFKCAPPIRERDNQDRLWNALAGGDIDFVVSDHSPCTPELKLLEQGDFQRAWGGISSLQLGLPAVWTEARRRGHGIEDVVRWMASEPARFLGLKGRKGALAEGCDADMVVFDAETEFTVSPEMIHHRHKLTPHEGRKLAGVVRRTYLRGVAVYDDGSFPASPAGMTILRNSSGENQ